MAAGIATQKGVRAIDARNSQLENRSNAAKKTVFALPGCQRMSVNTLLCDTLGQTGTKVRCESRLFSQGVKHQDSKKKAKFMNFSFWPFLWFGLPGRLLSIKAPRECSKKFAATLEKGNCLPEENSEMFVECSCCSQKFWGCLYRKEAPLIHKPQEANFREEKRPINRDALKGTNLRGQTPITKE